MIDCQFSKHLQSDDLDRMLLYELRKQLEVELEKNDSELDINKINQITKAIEKITESECITAEKTQQGIQELGQVIRHQRQRRAIRVSSIVAACVCAVVVVSNIWSYSAYGLNSFSAAYQLLNGGIKIDFQQDDSEPYCGNPYFDEMSSICQQYDLKVLIPTYLPRGFTPTENYGDFNEDEINKTILFYFKDRNAVLNFHILQYIDEDEVHPRVIPSESYNVSTQKIGETTVHIQKEKQQYWATFQTDFTQYIIYANKLDYDECQRVLESMFQE